MPEQPTAARDKAATQSERPGSPAERGLLLLILFAAFLLRLREIGLYLPRVYHPDEPFLAYVASRLSLSHLNPQFFHYPSGLLYLLRLLWSCLGIENDDLSGQILSGRVFVVLLGVLTVYGVWLLGRRVSVTAGLIAAAVLALSPLHVSQSRMMTVDVPLGCAVIFSLYFAGRLAQRGGWRELVLAAVLAGAAAGTKYNGALALAGIAVALLFQPKRKLAAMLPAAGAIAAATYLLLSPYTLLDFNSYWQGLVFDRAHMSSGHGAFGTSPSWLWYLHTGLLDTFLWPGVALALLGTVRIAAGRLRVLLPAMVFALVFFAAIASWQTRFIRYFDPLLPIIALLIGVGLAWIREWRLWRRPQYGTAFSALLVSLLLGGYACATLGAPAQNRTLNPRWQAEQWLLANAGDSVIVGDEYTPACDLAAENVWVRLRGHEAGCLGAVGRPQARGAPRRVLPTQVSVLKKYDWHELREAGVQYLLISREMWENVRVGSSRQRFYGELDRQARLVAVFSDGAGEWQVRIYMVAAQRAKD